MKNEFKEFKGKTNGFSVITLCHCLTEYAKNYIKETKLKINKEERDAILTTFINYLGYIGGCDLALYSKDLYEEKRYKEKIEPNKLITNLLNHGSYFLYKYNVLEVININKHMHNFKAQANFYNIEKVIVDFINYIAEVNYIERKFSIQELKERFTNTEYKERFKELKKFLLNSGTYSELFVNGETLENLLRDFDEYEEIIKEAYQSQYSEFYYDVVGKKEIESELYELVYAYVKCGIPTLTEPLSIQKLKLEMSQK